MYLIEVIIFDIYATHLLEILDDRYKRKSTVITSQLPTTHWHEHLNDATLADAILDRLLHNAIKLELKGESLRKLKNSLQTGDA
jgi:DNA replication protein DnaC